MSTEMDARKRIAEAITNRRCWIGGDCNRHAVEELAIKYARQVDEQLEINEKLKELIAELHEERKRHGVTR